MQAIRIEVVANEIRTSEGINRILGFLDCVSGKMLAEDEFIKRSDIQMTQSKLVISTVDGFRDRNRQRCA